MDKVDHANEWIKYAKADYSVAEHLKSAQHPTPIEIICFHCQQAGEKALKAVLAYHDEAIPRTHSLNAVLELCAMHYPKMQDMLAEQADHLSGFAVVTRYPNEVEVTEADMILALKYAGQILSHVETLWRYSKTTSKP